MPWKLCGLASYPGFVEGVKARLLTDDIRTGECVKGSYIANVDAVDQGQQQLYHNIGSVTQKSYQPITVQTMPQRRIAWAGTT
jgi:hypothetical protein